MNQTKKTPLHPTLESESIKVVYLPVSMSYVWLFGANLTTASILDIDGVRYHPTRDAALAAMNRKLTTPNSLIYITSLKDAS